MTDATLQADCEHIARLVLSGDTAAAVQHLRKVKTSAYEGARQTAEGYGPSARAFARLIDTLVRDEQRDRWIHFEQTMLLWDDWKAREVYDNAMQAARLTTEGEKSVAQIQEVGRKSDLRYRHLMGGTWADEPMEREPLSDD